MSTWQERLQFESEELDDRICKLKKMLHDYALGILNFTPNCSLELLTMQLNHMLAYQQILHTRLNIELKDADV